MKILITGGAGFIGSNIADSYIEAGHEVAVVDNLATGFKHNIHSDAKFYECDICNREKLSHAFTDFAPDVVSHHAAQLDVRKSVSDPSYDANININGALNVLMEAVRVGSHRFIFASTGGAVYGEPKFLPVTEKHSLNPESPYGLTKFTFEHYLRIWSNLHDITPVVLRYANVYGPRQTAHGEGGVVAIFSQLLLDGKQCTIFGDGTMTRDYVYVGDVVNANLLALEKGDNNAMNIGTGIETSTLEVFEAVSKCVGSALSSPNYCPERPGEVRRIYLENSYAKQVLGWKPQTELLQGVAHTVEALRKI